MPKKKIFTEEQEEEIAKMYNKNLESPKNIGKFFGCGSKPIVRILEEKRCYMNISGRRKLLFRMGKLKTTRIDFTKEQRKEIVRRYVKCLENLEEIGKYFGYSHTVIRRILVEEKRYMIIGNRRRLLIKEGRIKPTENLGSFARDGNPHNKGKTKDNYEPLMKLSKSTKGRKAPWLTKRNLENNPMNDTSVRVKSSKTKRNKFMNEEYKERYLKTNKGIFKEGEEHPFFNNWSSLEPYDKDFNEKFKKSIRERDGICMLCNVSLDDLRLLNRQINVHHINYDKKCSISQNCCILCNNCHAKTNINRPHWQKFFQSLLSERYGYQYSEAGEIILNLSKTKIY